MGKVIILHFSIIFPLCSLRFHKSINMFQLLFDTHADFTHAVCLLEGVDLDGISTVGPPLTIQVDTLDVLVGVLLRLLPQGISVKLICM